MYSQSNDDKLSGRIKEVFENFEDDSADLGWTELRKKFPAEKKRKPLAVWWWSSAAAILLIVGGVTLYKSSETVYLTSKPGTEVKEKDLRKPTFDTFEERAGVRTEEDPGAKEEASSRNILMAESRPESQSSVSKSQITQAVPQAQKDLVSALESKSSQEDINEIVLREEQRVLAAKVDEKAPRLSITSESEGDRLENSIVTDMLQNKASSIIGLAEVPESPNSPKVQPKKDKNLSFAVFAGSYVNYANGSQSGMNTGVGISSEIRLSKKLKISTGVSLAQNTLKYEGEVPLAAAADFRSNIAVESKLDLGNEKILAPVLPASYSLNNYDASLLGLDIPINLKYTLLQNKNELYVIAGVSSNFFLEESYSYSYELSRGASNSIATKEDEFASAKAENFDFARMINFSVGFGHPLGKQSRLSFEPFVKYPIGGQGARDLRFGAAGMNLKLNFSRLKF